jgi:adenylate cyclase
MAMWGAPMEQEQHATLAIQAALAMLEKCAALDAESYSTHKIHTRIGIGLNSGEAQVGNVGSAARSKYGPLGDVVNVASRIQGITKHLKCPLLVSRETWEQGRIRCASRRVVCVRLTGIQQERDLYELSNPESGREEFFHASEEALDALENGHFGAALHQAGKLLEEPHSGDGPLLLVATRAMHALQGQGFDRVWAPPGK